MNQTDDMAVEPWENPDGEPLPASTINKLTRNEMIRQAVTLRMAGASYNQIGRQLGIATNTAHKYVQEALNSIPRDAVDDVRLMNHMRLEHVLMLVWPDVQRKDPWAVTTAFGVIDRLNRMYGTDVPDKAPATTNQTVNVGSMIVAGQVTTEQYVRAMQMARGEVVEGDLAVPYQPITADIAEDDEPLHMTHGLD